MTRILAPSEYAGYIDTITRDTADASGGWSVITGHNYRYLDVTISAVDLSLTVARTLHGGDKNAAGTALSSGYFCEFTSTTNLRIFTSGNSDPGTSHDIPYQIIEYKPGAVFVQQVTHEINPVTVANHDETITSVDTARAEIYGDIGGGYHWSAGGSDTAMWDYSLPNSTTLRVAVGQEHGTANARFNAFVVEFKGG